MVCLGVGAGFNRYDITSEADVREAIGRATPFVVNLPRDRSHRQTPSRLA